MDKQLALIFDVDDIKYIVNQESLEKFQQGALAVGFTDWQDTVPFICIALAYSGQGYTEREGYGNLPFFIKSDSEYILKSKDRQDSIDRVTEVFRKRGLKNGFITMRESPNYRMIVMHASLGTWQPLAEIYTIMFPVDHL